MSARDKLAAVVAAVALAEKAPFISKEREYRRCLALSLDLLGELVAQLDVSGERIFQLQGDVLQLQRGKKTDG